MVESEIKNLIDFNVKNLKSNSNFSFINYLDTSNLTRNQISEIQKISIGDFPSRAKRILQKNDILISTVRPKLCHYGIIKSPVENMIASTGFVVLRTNSETNPFFLYYFLSQELVTKYLASLAEGATTSYPSITPEDVYNLKIDIPLLNEQKKIANILSKLDDKIELNNKINKELEEMAKDLYNYWFVQFDFPDENGNPYKSSGGEMVYNEKLKREIPIGSKILFLKDIYDFKYGKENKNPDNGGKYPIYGSNGVIGGFDKYNSEESPVIGHIGACGSLIFARGKHFVTYNGIRCNIRDGYNKYFGFAILLSKDLEKSSLGSIQPFISYDMLNPLDVIIPRDDLIKKYLNIVIPIFEKLFSNQSENQELIQLRDFLLPMLMNGQVKVK